MKNWVPLIEAEWMPPTPEIIAEQARLNDLPPEAIIAMFEEQNRTATVWKNDIYQVARRVLDPERAVIHLNIRRIDGAAIIRDWRHFQQIKNELIGEECEAIELYPAESRLVDTSNKYHLVGVADPTFRFPFGDIFGNRRDVSYESGTAPGTRQRAREE
jgi:hypothetical protein